MSKHPPASRTHHNAFCEAERWTLVRGATGKTVSHHRTYELPLRSGRILRTRISRPIDKSEYRPSMWSHILRYQLEVDTDAFWRCVSGGELPEREPTRPRPDSGLSFYLLDQITRMLGVDPREAATMTDAEAQAILNQYWTTRADEAEAFQR
ncbi:cytotoxic translational repressor of toxin-antitoxin stability system [Okibacterium fritillariae]|uniref:Cytotoxic translational repressor of toxin-antitoxin stability system n=1 Tax=Okibacterium fritillariae TaxID=123320 RepID=A0A1T5L056_9MICO|nr:cytotoxic translational repressor of toxin-antitoxin stability system [Okibacterium fritillariae]SKC68778.1 hypothetical protein SAMN06309945_2677 [Okibacterium fritillariae]